MSQRTLAQLAQIEKAARIAKPSDVKSVVAEVALTAEAKALPPHIIACTEARKLNLQTPIFRCPAWADLPSKPWHLRCTRDDALLPALELHRYPFYLLGKNSLCDFVLEHPSVSSVHAALVFHKEHECFVLVDLGSTNGTRVNGERVERQKPVPVPAGAKLQFGYSTRVYEMRSGRPPPRSTTADGGAMPAATHAPAHSANHPRSESATEAGPLKRARSERTDGGGEAVTSASTAHGESRPPSASPPSHGGGHTTTARADEKHGCHQENEASTAAAAAPEAIVEARGPAEGEPERVHLYHLVIKHKDVENAVSRGAHNKGELVTRSRQDALDTARFVLSSHAAAHRPPPGAGPLADKGPSFDHWTVDEFVRAVTEYSEIATGKKKAGGRAAGDLGIVERGTFSDEFDSAAFALRREEVSEPVETQLGVHLIYRCD